MFSDIFLVSCFFIRGSWKKSDAVECQSLLIPYFAVGLAPFWFRMMQTLRKYYDHHTKIHLFNFVKYLVTFLWFLNETFNNYHGFTRVVSISLGIVVTLYNHFWDISVDWGLLRSKKKNVFMLRDVIIFSKWFYY